METILLVCLIIVLATAAHAVFGFGTALVAMPLLTALIGLKTAAPTVALVMTVANFFILSGSWRHMDRPAVIRLIGASFLGLIPGLWLVYAVDERLVMAALGLILISYALYRLTRPALPRIEGSAWAYAAGFSAGILGAAFNTNGPPVVLYGAARGWAPDEMRGSLQAFFVPTSLSIVLAHGAGGLWTVEVFQLVLWSLPAMAVGLFVGGRLARLIDGRRFDRALDVTLILLGVFLIV